MTSDADDDIHYFSDIQSALDLFGAREAAAAQESLEAGDERSQFFASLTNAGAGVAFVDSLEALQEIVPSEGYENDHARLIQLYEELTRADARFGEAAEAQDLSGVITGNLRLARAGQLAALDLSPNTCTLVSDAEFCNRHVTSGSDYETGINDAGLRWDAPRGAAVREIAPGDPGPFGAGLATREERLAIIEELTTFALEVDAEFLANARQLTLDAAYVQDHARLIELAESVQSLHGDVLAAAQAGDFVELTLLESALLVDDAVFRATTSAASCDLFGIGGPPCGTAGAAPRHGYGAAVFSLLRDFALQSVPAGIDPWNPLPTEEETASAMGALAEQRRAAISAIVAGLDALVPDAAQADDHAVLVNVLTERVEIEQGLVDSYAAGTLGTLAPDGPEVAAWTTNICRLASELSPEGYSAAHVGHAARARQPTAWSSTQPV